MWIDVDTVWENKLFDASCNICSARLIRLDFLLSVLCIFVEIWYHWNGLSVKPTCKYCFECEEYMFFVFLSVSIKQEMKNIHHSLSWRKKIYILKTKINVIYLKCVTHQNEFTYWILESNSIELNNFLMVLCIHCNEILGLKGPGMLITK
jgi:hypothetical protein